MSKIRESIVSSSEKKFVVKSLNEGNRLDGRAFDKFRDLQIQLGKDWGCCYVSLGQTRVLAQVSCEVQQPKASRPSEGLLNINLELNPLGAPNFEAGRQSELSVQLNRLLEKCLKDSKAVDLESLCIKVNEKVWAFRVDINVLNHEGNILDAASIAALCALAHFRRPDFTCDGEEVIIHTYAQRDPIPTVIHHHPICISFAIFNDGGVILVDPTLLEESVAEAHLTVGLNAYKELCGLHLGGSALISADLILTTAIKAASRASDVISEIKKHIEDDNKIRMQRKGIGFHQNLHAINEDFKSAQENLGLYLDKWSVPRKGKRKEQKKESRMEVDVPHESAGIVESLGKGSAVLLPQEEGDKQNIWRVSSDEESESETNTNDTTPQCVPQVQQEQDVTYKYDKIVEECIYKDKFRYNIVIGGTEYPFIQHFEKSKFCLVCGGSTGMNVRLHVRSYKHNKELQISKTLDEVKAFHDMWMSQPADMQFQQSYFRRRRNKITCTLCSTFVFYCKDSLGEHLISEGHKLRLLKMDNNKSDTNFELNGDNIEVTSAI